MNSTATRRDYRLLRNVDDTGHPRPEASEGSDTNTQNAGIGAANDLKVKNAPLLTRIYV